jgi:DNA modification methylase
VELEKRFFNWMEKARENVEKHPTLTAKGWIRNICGDARRLSELLTQVDIAITSPPYEMQHQGGPDAPKVKHGCVKEKYPSKDNIGNLPLGNVDAVITSPPYADAKKGGEADEDAMAERWDRIVKERNWNTWGKTWKTEGRKRALKSLGSGYSASKENIGNLPLGNIDVVITSPPYGESYLGGGDSEKRRERLIKAGYNPKDFLGGRARNTVLKHYDEVDTIITSPPYSESLSAKSGGMRGMKNAPKDSTVGIDGNPQLYSQSEQNIGNLPLGNVDAVITSPPYLKSAESGAGVNRQREGDVRIGCSTIGRTVEHPDAIDNVRDYGSIDAVITSPPYEGSLEGTSRHTKGGIPSRDPCLGLTGTYATKSRENIGNLKSSDEEYEMLARGLMTKSGKPTYLSEMLKVYAQMFKVLKPNGLAIIIVKPFIRNRKPVDLPYHTYLLMSMVGFKLEKLYKLRLKNFSFWRVLYMKKYPEVPRISHEYVLVCRKNVSHITPS